MFHYLFDSNAIRDFGRRVSGSDWTRIWASWKGTGSRTAWIPWTIGEVVGSNLLGLKNPVTAAECEQTALAVRRFDKLSARDILPHPRDLLRWSFNTFAHLSVPFPFVTEEREVRDLIDIAKGLSSPDQISAAYLGDGSYQVGIKDLLTDEYIGQVIPAGFAEATTTEVSKWVERLKSEDLLGDNPTHGSIVEIIMERIHEIVWSQGSRIGIAESVLKATLDGNRMAEMTRTPFLCGAVAQHWYYIERALGRKTGKVLETIGRDLMIAAYIPVGGRFVTSDGEFLGLLKKLYPLHNLITMDQFICQLGGQVS